MERTLHTVLTVDTLVTVDTVLTIRYVFNYPYFLQSVATAIRCNSASSERYRLRWALPRLASAQRRRDAAYAAYCPRTLDS